MTRLVGKSKPTLYELAVMSMLFIAFLKAIRFGSYVLLATPILLYGQNKISLTQGKLKMIIDFFSPLRRYKTQIYGGFLASLIILSVYPLRNVHGGLMNNLNQKFEPHALQIVEVLHREHPSWKLWNEYDLGGTLEMAGIPVAIDGRTDLYAPDGVLKDYVQVRNSDVGAYSKFLHYGANYVCIYKTDSLGELLDVSHAWAKVYSGKLYEVYVRKGEA